MIELTCVVCSAIWTSVIAYFSGWFSDLSQLWKFPLVFIGLGLAVLLLIFLVTFILSQTVDIKKPVEKPSAFHTFVYNCFVGFLIRLFRLRFKVKNEQMIPDEPCLFIMNHRSDFDPMLLTDRYKKKHILMISKPSNFKIPIAGGFIHKAGFMAIDRENDREALKTVLLAANRLKEGYSVCVYPEGTRNKTGINLLPFRHGAFKVATKVGAPIVIANIHETQKIHKNFPLRRTYAQMNVLSVLRKEDYNGKSTAEISQYAMEIMQADIDAFASAD